MAEKHLFCLLKDFPVMKISESFSDGSEKLNLKIINNIENENFDNLDEKKDLERRMIRAYILYKCGKESIIDENKDLTIYFGDSSQYSVRILDNTGNPVDANTQVTFNINGVFYTRNTTSDGYAKLNLNLQPGDYIITAEYNSCKVSNSIRILSVLNASDLKKSYKNPAQSVKFNINGVIYYRMSDSDGIASLNINLQKGQYIITSSYNNLNIANTITIT